MKIVKCNEFDFEWFKSIKLQKRHKGNPGTRSKIRYKDIITAFDIETARIVEIEQSIMYIWQWAFDDICVIGRTWDDFIMFASAISLCLNENEKLFVAVHNLSYEFQFLKGVYEFTDKDVFALDNRKVLKCEMYSNIEFRCSYMHANMKLEEYLAKMGAEHGKLSGAEFDYDKVRYPWTPLSDQELAYCVHDVIGLVEAIKIEMEHDGDNIYSYPLTQTGYVRRDAKRCMQKISHLWVKKQLPNMHLYEMEREAFRGGNTHANRFYAGRIINDVWSVDRSSSYPDVLVNHRFPIAQFAELGAIDEERFNELYRVTHRAILMRVAFTNIRLKHDDWGCPYLSRDKSRKIASGVYDNGRILQAEYLETTITDIDYSILEWEYVWDEVYYLDVAYSRYGNLPQPFKDLINEYYRRKTTLKGVESEELNYFRAKQKLNSLYGMCAQNPCRAPIIFEAGELHEDMEADMEELLNKDNKRRQLPPYHIGVWCTAWARWELEEGLKEVYKQDGEFIYTDTDSIKFKGSVDFAHYNKQRERRSISSGSYADDPGCNRHYMGVFETEGSSASPQFITYGAKKYAYTDEKGKLHITVAGVIKNAGARELEAHGGIKEFKTGFIFKESGGLEAVYNDFPDITSYEVDGHKIDITSNVVLRPSTYTLGITDEYEYLLFISGMQNYVDVF